MMERDNYMDRLKESDLVWSLSSNKKLIKRIFRVRDIVPYYKGRDEMNKWYKLCDLAFQHVHRDCEPFQIIIIMKIMLTCWRLPTNPMKLHYWHESYEKIGCDPGDMDILIKNYFHLKKAGETLGLREYPSPGKFREQLILLGKLCQ